MKKFVIYSIFTLLLFNTLSAQENAIVTIDGKPVSKEEFELIYRKNNTNLNDESEIKSPKEYMDMYIDFKLKVTEAENKGLDTVTAFKDELAGYRSELAKVYLTDVSVTDSMVKDVYYRSVNYVSASHILINVKANASPEDTLKAYNRALEIRNKYINKEKTFEELAVEYSEDPSAAKNSGDLGYFKAFRMIAPFEDAAYSTKVGEVSMPFRTKFGYHIIKVKDKVKSEGSMRVAHIMLMFKNPEEITTEETESLKIRIDSIYKLLQNGGNFEELAKQLSEDKMSSNNGGKMKPISQDFEIAEFKNAAFSLKNDGDYTTPVKTPYGWHIIKRISLTPEPSFNEMEQDLTSKVKSDPQRSKYCKAKFTDKMKALYGYTYYADDAQKFYSYIDNLEKDTIDGELPEDIAKLKMFNFAGKDYTANEYFNFIKSKSRTKDRTLKATAKNKLYDFEDVTTTEYEDSRLGSKYPEFKSLISEYHDGILLFTIMENEVWNKAAEDSLGLQKLYDKNKKKYPLGEHFDGLLVKCKDEESKITIDKLISEGITDPTTLEGKVNTEDSIKVNISKGRWEKGSNKYIDCLIWNGEKPKDFIENLYYLHGSVKPNGVKTLDEARGLYISDYQAIIEKEWLKYLHKKYKVTVNEKLLRTVESIKKK
jgi:peptidyl-prolyl cis-trans isomerase SurA